MAKYKLLSYLLNENTPLYGESRPLLIIKDKCIAEGDSCNTSAVSFSNHSGTHIDAPKHFDETGRSLWQYNIEELIFNSPCVLDCPKTDDELVLAEDLDGLGKDCDILLIRTGFHQFRNKPKYQSHNPGISPEAAKLLRLQYPHIRAVGIDSISITAFQNRENGREAHNIFLKKGQYPGEPILLIEDMDLSGEINGLKKIFAIPLFVSGVDSMPSTVIGVFD